MTLCRKCGKEIMDGEELCQECQSKEDNLSEEYLDELMQSMEQELNNYGIEEPVAEEQIIEEEPEETIPEEETKFEEEMMPVEEAKFEEEIMPAEEMMLEEGMPAEEEMMPEEGMPAEEEMMPVEETNSEEETSGNDEDINDLLSLLSQDYEDEEDVVETTEPEQEQAQETVMPSEEEMPAEASLFSQEDDEGGLFADDADALSVDDIFDDALSAIDYSEAEPKEEVLEEFVVPDESGQTSEDALGDLVLDTLALDEGGVSEEEIGQAVAPASPMTASKKKREKKDSLWKRVFGNIITEQTAEEEAKEREAEQATAAEKAAAREEKKKQVSAAKAEKAEQAKAEKEKKAAERAEQAAVKAAEKEEKKRLKAEALANEVVGKINPVGASIVMVFFGLICILTIIGSQVLSHSTSVRGAQSSFEERDYKGAYESLAGVEISEESASYEMKDKIRICMQLQRQMDSYENYYQMKMYLEALDALMKGIRSYDANQSKAERYNIVSQYNELEVKLAQQLYQEFGVSETQARSINSIEGQAEYTARLENIISQWEKRNREDER